MGKVDDPTLGRGYLPTPTTAAVGSLGNVKSLIGTQHWAGWSNKGFQLALAGLSLWWTSLWPPVGVAGVVLLVTLVTVFQVVPVPQEGYRVRGRRGLLWTH